MDENELLYCNDFQKNEIKKMFLANITESWKLGIKFMSLLLVAGSVIILINSLLKGSYLVLLGFILFMLLGILAIVIGMVVDYKVTLKVAKNFQVYEDGIYIARKKIVSFDEISSVFCKYSNFLFRLENGKIEKISKYIILDLEKFNNILKSKGVEILFDKYAIHPSLAKLK